MKPNYAGAALLNLPLAADVDTTTMSGSVLLPGHTEPIKTVDLVEILHDDEATEVQQLVTVTLPTIAIDTVYGIRAGSQATELEVSKIGIRSYKGSLSPLTGTAATDKSKIGEQIARGINGFLKNYAEAGMRTVMTHAATVAPGGFSLGEIIVGSTSGAKAIIRVISALTPTVDIIEGVFVGSEVLTGLTSGRTSTFTSHVAVSTMVIVDKAGYHPALGSRGGALNVYPGPNIPASAIVVTTAAVNGFGVGARLLDDVPSFDPRSGNLSTGLLMMPTNEAPLDGQLYKRAIVVYKKDVSVAATGVGGATLTYAYVVWYDADAAGAAAFKAALDALVA